ncbi:MAG: hypothetical protein FWG83_00210 [Oscillospiraceae bacterium]|nr:hypothetical protein [Oscillospiraceae bacterium]
MADKVDKVAEYTPLAVMLEQGNMQGMRATFYEILADAKGVTPEKAREDILKSIGKTSEGGEGNG